MSDQQNNNIFSFFANGLLGGLQKILSGGNENRENRNRHNFRNINHFFEKEDEDSGPIPFNELNQNQNINSSSNIYKCRKCGTIMDINLKDDHILSHQYEEGIINTFIYRNQGNNNNSYNQNRRIRHNNDSNFNILEQINDELREEPDDENSEEQNDNRNEIEESDDDIAFYQLNRGYRNRMPHLRFNNGSSISFELDDNMDDSIEYQHNPVDQKIIEDLTESIIKDTSKLSSENKSCLICLEEYHNGEKAIFLPCVHIFHPKCIKEWLTKQNSCPICKFELTYENIYKNN